MATSTPKLGLTKPAGTELYSRAILNGNSDIIDTFATNQALTSEGGKNLGKTTVNSGAVSVHTVIHNIASFTFKAGRRYRVVWHGQFSCSVASALWAFRIHSASTADAAALVTGLTTIQSRTLPGHSVAANQIGFFVEAFQEPVADITLQMKFTVINASGGGTITVTAAATEPTYFYIEDWGDMF